MGAAIAQSEPDVAASVLVTLKRGSSAGVRSHGRPILQEMSGHRLGLQEPSGQALGSNGWQRHRLLLRHRNSLPALQSPKRRTRIAAPSLPELTWLAPGSSIAWNCRCGPQERIRAPDYKIVEAFSLGKREFVTRRYVSAVRVICFPYAARPLRLLPEWRGPHRRFAPELHWQLLPKALVALALKLCGCAVRRRWKSMAFEHAPYRGWDGGAGLTV